MRGPVLGQSGVRESSRDRIILVPFRGYSASPYRMTTMFVRGSQYNKQSTPRLTPSDHITTSPVTPYHRLDIRSLGNYQLAVAIDRCESLDSILAIFNEQSWAFDGFRNGHPKLIKWLIPVVNGLHVARHLEQRRRHRQPFKPN